MNNTEVWLEILDMIEKSDRKIEVYTDEADNEEDILTDLGISPDSVLGIVISNTSGIMIDNTIRILGKRSLARRDILSYNRNKPDGLIIVADDIFGGVFAVNVGNYSVGWGIGEICYFAPDTLEWENLEFKYGSFLTLCISTDKFDKFYESFRWKNFSEDCKKVGFDEGMLIYPFLWSKEIDIETADKKVVPIDELFNMNMEFREKFKIG